MATAERKIIAARNTARPANYANPDTATMPQPFDGFSWAATPKSTMFTRIGYNAVTETLRVVFRNSGKQFEYRNFSAIRWYNFFRAKSFGAHARKYIFSKDRGTELR
jgi:KTSC domain-containing protein